jgi:mono/diheme cytochrome c family protein
MRTLSGLILAASLLPIVFAQDSSPRKPLASVDGKELFVAYCASCHGMDGRGGGPVAPALKGRVPDLTILTARNNGKFPGAELEKTILGETAKAVHGTREMPIWGPVFRRVENDQDLGLVRTRRLVEYLQTLQKPKR